MLLLIIFAAAFIFCGVVFITTTNKYYDVCHYVFNGLIATIGLVGVFSVGVLALIKNGSIERHNVRVWHEESVMSFHATEAMISTIKDDYARSVAIQQYNHDVKEFKVKILANQEGLRNPFVNICYCSEYNNINANAVSYISII